MKLRMLYPTQINGRLYAKEDELTFPDSSDPQVLLEVAERVASGILVPVDELPPAVRGVADRYAEFFRTRKGPEPTAKDFAAKKPAATP